MKIDIVCGGQVKGLRIDELQGGKFYKSLDDEGDDIYYVDMTHNKSIVRFFKGCGGNLVVINKDGCYWGNVRFQEVKDVKITLSSE